MSELEEDWEKINKKLIKKTMNELEKDILKDMKNKQEIKSTISTIKMAIEFLDLKKRLKKWKMI